MIFNYMCSVPLRTSYNAPMHTEDLAMARKPEAYPMPLADFAERYPTLVEVAAVLNVSRPTISKWLRDEREVYVEREGATYSFYEITRGLRRKRGG